MSLEINNIDNTFQRELGGFATLLLAFFLLIPNSLFSQNTWTQKADFGGVGRSGGVSATLNGKGYAGLGTDNVTNFDDWWEYDADLNTWTQKADFNGVSRAYGVIFEIDNIAYFGTGQNSGGSLSDFYKYDPIANSWTSISSMPGPSRGEAYAFSTNGKGYVGCGVNRPSLTLLNDFYEYDPDSDSWTQKTNFPGSARASGWSFTINGKGYFGTGSGFAADVYEYNPISNSWLQKANYGGGGYALSGRFVIGNKGYVIAGRNSGNSNTDDVYEFDPILNIWTQKATIPGGLNNAYWQFGFSVNGKGYIGTGAHTFMRKDFYEYTPGTTPSVNTTIISNINLTTATSGGDVIFNGNYAVTARGVVWSTSANPTIASQPGGGITSNGTGDGTYTSSLTGLTPSTQYYYRAYATNSQGTSYGEQYTFTTTQTGGTWARQTDFVGGRGGNVGFSIANKGFQTCGFNGSTHFKDLWEYDPTTCQWTQKANFIGNPRRELIAININNKAYVGLGFDGTVAYNDFYEYDNVTNSWIQKANFPGASRGASIGFSINSNGYVGIGYNGFATFFNDFYEYNPLSNSWTQKANFPGGVRYVATGFSLDNLGYIGLGANNIGTNHNDLWEYNPTSDIWLQKNNLPITARTYAVPVIIENEAYIFGGYNGTNYLSDCYKYNKDTDTWSSIPNFIGNSRATTFGLTIGNIAYYGLGFNGSYLADFYSYKPNSAPEISTTAISAISTTSASSGGNVLANGGEALTARGLVWSSNTNPPTISDYEGITTNGTGTGAFTQTINALCPGTTYYVRAYATNSIGTSYGAVQTFTTTASAGDIWVQRTSFPNTRRWGFANSSSTRGYHGCGYDGTTWQNDFWEYNPNDNTWTQKANFAGNSRVNIPSFVIENKIYTATGNNGVTLQTETWEYDPSSNIWTSRAAFIGNARNSGVGFAINGRGYICGGYDLTNWRAELYEYNPIANSWIQKSNIPNSGREQLVAFTIGNLSYVGLGYNGVTSLNDFYSYNPITDTWTSRAAYPGEPGSQGDAIAIGNKGYVGPTNYNSQLWEYDPTFDQWKQRSNFAGGNRQSIRAFSIGNKVYMGFGFDGVTIFNTLYEYTPSTTPQFFATDATNVTQLTADVSANYDVNFNGCGDGSITEKGFVWDVNPNPTTTTNSGILNFGSGNSNFSATLENLSHTTTYYLRAYTTNSQGTIYGNEITFSTIAPTPPVLGNLEFPAFGDESVSLRAPLQSLGGVDLQSSGFVYSTLPNPDLSNYPGGGIVYFTYDLDSNYYHLTGLSPETTYYIVGFATNEIGTTYSNEISFTTRPFSTDDDSDGISDADENRGPNRGDGNGDGIADGLQANVATFFVDGRGQFLTVEARNCATLTNVRRSTPEFGNRYFFPYGVVEFSVPCGEVNMQVYYHGLTDFAGLLYRKTNAEGIWGTYRTAEFGIKNVGGSDVATVTFPLADGGIGDSDGKIDGVITDPGGAAFDLIEQGGNIPIWDNFARGVILFSMLAIGFFVLRKKL